MTVKVIFFFVEPDSLLVFAFIAILVTYEVKHYLQSGIQYKYDIDPDFDKYVVSIFYPALTRI